MNSFGEFPRGGQRRTVELLQPRPFGQLGEQALQRLVVVKGQDCGVERRDGRRSRWHRVLSRLHKGTGSRHLDDSNW